MVCLLTFWGLLWRLDPVVSHVRYPPLKLAPALPPPSSYRPKIPNRSLKSFCVASLKHSDRLISNSANSSRVLRPYSLKSTSKSFKTVLTEPRQFLLQRLATSSAQTSQARGVCIRVDRSGSIGLGFCGPSARSCVAWESQGGCR